MKTRVRACTAFALFSVWLLGSSCQKEVEPTPMASFTLYTQISSKFDRLDVYIDKQLVGAITTAVRSTPACGATTTAAVLTTPVAVGNHAIEVKQVYQNNEVGIWDDWTLSFTEGQCVRRNLTE